MDLNNFILRSNFSAASIIELGVAALICKLAWRRELRQEDLKFQASQRNLARSCLKTKIKRVEET